MKKVKPEKNQNIMDIAVQEYGNRLAVFQIIEDNPGLSNDDNSEIFSIEKTLAPIELNIRTQGDLVINQVRRELKRKVTSYIEGVKEEEATNFLATENGTAITDEDGNKILLTL